MGNLRWKKKIWTCSSTDPALLVTGSEEISDKAPGESAHLVRLRVVEKAGPWTLRLPATD